MSSERCVTHRINLSIIDKLSQIGLNAFKALTLTLLFYINHITTFYLTCYHFSGDIIAVV